MISSVPKMWGGVLSMMPTALYLGFPMLFLKSPPQDYSRSIWRPWPCKGGYPQCPFGNLNHARQGTEISCLSVFHPFSSGSAAPGKWPDKQTQPPSSWLATLQAAHGLC